MLALRIRTPLWRSRRLLRPRSPNLTRSLASLSQSNRPINPGETLHGFTLEKSERFPVFDLTGYLLRHDKTGAEYLHLARDDDPNKVFAISFRTNPPDATGVPHILEHTTLCGSEKYPVRDPFFKMLPRSLSHFMNAMTSSEHTTYPFATTNLQDFNNLLSVYMDATLHPLLEAKDFRQEGWRIGPQASYSSEPTEAGSSRMEFKGVVYNEMKGQMSDASYLYYIRWHEHIAPYLNNSGGDPQRITDLTHQRLVDFHSKNYHPSNSKIFTYSNIPLEQHLQEIGQQLDRFETRPADDLIIDPIDLSKGSVNVTVDGPVDTNSPLEKQYRTSVSWVLDHDNDLIRRFSQGLMTNLLIDGYSSPMYRSLIESGLGQSFSPVTGSMRIGHKSVFSLGVINTDEAGVHKVKQAIADTLIRQYEKGFDKEKIDGILHQMDLGIKHKSANFGMSIMNRIVPEWLKGVHPFQSLAWQQIIDGFKERYAQPRYLENLLEESLLKNNNMTFTMKPTESYHTALAQDETSRLSSKLEGIYSQFKTKEEANQYLISQEETLNNAQSQKQDLSCLPTLTVKDIPRSKPIKEVHHSIIEGVNTQWRLAPTNGISYVRMVNVLQGLPEELQELLPLFSECLMRLGTKDMTMEQLEDQIKLKTGGITVAYHSTTSPSNIRTWEQGLKFSGYALDRNVPALYDLMRAMILETNFDSAEAEANIRELLLASSSTAFDSIADSGSLYAKGYAMAGLTPEYRAKESVSGLSQFYLTMQLLRDAPNSLKAVINKLKLIQRFALSSSNKLRAAVTCGSEAKEANERSLSRFLSSLPKSADMPSSSSTFSSPLDLDAYKAYLKLKQFQVSHVGFAVPGVEYVNPSGASLSILSQLLTHKYLHQAIRETGGAYGAGAASHGLGGVFSMSSYRDPMPDRSVKIMQSAGKWATGYDFNNTDLEEAKLSVFKGLDALEDIHHEGMLLFLNGIDPEMEQRRREQLLDVKIDDVKAAAQRFLVDGMAESRAMIIGNKAPTGRGALEWKELQSPAQLLS
jgi:presequence protease